MTKKKSTKKHTTKKKAPNTTTPQQMNTTTLVLSVIIVLLLGFIIVDKISTDSSPTSPSNDNANVANAQQGTNFNDVIIIEEYSDFECPFCARALPTVNQLKEKYGDKIQIEYKHFPLSFHPNAQAAAEASECARDQGMFWEYHDILFENQQALGAANLKQYAAQLGLDTQKFNTCLDSGEKTQLVLDDMAEGRQKGVSGTPTFFIGGESIVGAQSLSAFDSLIAKAGNGEIAAPTPDPEISLTIITDPACSVCTPEQIETVLTGELFPTTKVTRLTVDDAEAQTLLNELAIEATPAFIYEATILEAARFIDVSDAFEQRGDKYVVTPRAVGNVKLMKEPSIDGLPIKGDPNAPITMIEYSDFECPFCTKFYDESLPGIVENYINTGKVKLVYKHFPLSFHANAKPAAEASECAGEQDRFWEMHDKIFENQRALSTENYITWAQEIGVANIDQFTECVNSGKYGDKVDQHFIEGGQDGVSGTPGFVVNGIVVGGAQPYEYFQELFDQLLAS